MYYLIFLLALISLFFTFTFPNCSRKDPTPNQKSAAPQNTEDKVRKSAERTFRYIVYISPFGAEQHIKQRHWYNASRKSGTSYFLPDMTIEKLHRLATITLNKGHEREGRNGRLIYQYHFSYPLGTTPSGKLAYGLRIVIDPKNSDEQHKHVITAFPVK